MRILLICLIFCFGDNLTGQEESRTKNFAGLGISYGIDFPSGDMADRFGTSFHAGLSIDFFRSKWKGNFGIEGYIHFGDNVKEDIFSPLRTESGRILGNDGQLAEVFARQRGISLGLYTNKVLVPLKNNPMAGLSGFFGLGIMQHKIRIQDDRGNAGQFSGDYVKGYDRYSIGPYLKQGIEYLHIGKNKSLNYSVSLFITEGFTKGKREVNFDNQLSDQESRFDLLIGLNVKWYLPIIDQREPKEIYY